MSKTSSLRQIATASLARCLGSRAEKSSNVEGAIWGHQQTASQLHPQASSQDLLLNLMLSLGYLLSASIVFPTSPVPTPKNLAVRRQPWNKHWIGRSFCKSLNGPLSHGQPLDLWPSSAPFHASILPWALWLSWAKSWEKTRFFNTESCFVFTNGGNLVLYIPGRHQRKANVCMFKQHLNVAENKVIHWLIIRFPITMAIWRVYPIFRHTDLSIFP